MNRIDDIKEDSYFNKKNNSLFVLSCENIMAYI
jgi:hypothetical protein